MRKALHVLYKCYKWSINFNFTAEEAEYLDRCARTRCISRSALLRRLIRTIARDELVLSILDDDSKPGRGKYEYPYREAGGVQ